MINPDNNSDKNRKNHAEMMRALGLEPWSDEEKAGVWECDGCHIRGAFDKLDKHIDDVNTLPDGSLKEPQDVTCWGAMQVGSDIWKQYWDHGVHPMVNVMKAVTKVYDDFTVQEMETQFPTTPAQPDTTPNGTNDE
jgi:hypothetical protein